MIILSWGFYVIRILSAPVSTGGRGFGQALFVVSCFPPADMGCKGRLRPPLALLRFGLHHELSVVARGRPDASVVFCRFALLHSTDCPCYRRRARASLSRSAPAPQSSPTSKTLPVALATVRYLPSCPVGVGCLLLVVSQGVAPLPLP